MAKKPTGGRRKLVEFDAETWHALNLLSRETMKRFRSLPMRRSAICCTSMHGHRFEGGARQSAKDAVLLKRPSQGAFEMSVVTTAYSEITKSAWSN